MKNPFKRHRLIEAEKQIAESSKKINNLEQDVSYLISVIGLKYDYSLYGAGHGNKIDQIENRINLLKEDMNLESDLVRSILDVIGFKVSNFGEKRVYIEPINKKTKRG